MIDVKEFSIDKSDWKKVKFGDVVFEPKESVKDPIAEGIEHVVGLEHIDSENIHLRRYENIEKSTTFTKKFCANDVLFGRRRAYLKKAAKAGFDGICSGDITVMRANEKLISGLLPFLVNSDAFFDFAITHSAGGLSPRVKFKDLANFKLLLPPKDQQLSFLELMMSIVELQERQVDVIHELSRTKKSILKETFLKENCIKVRVSDISENLDNRRVPIKKSERVPGIYPYYGASGVVDHVSEYIFDEPILLISEDGENLNSRKLPIAYEVDEKCWVNNHAHVLKITEASRYLVAEYFNFNDVSDYISGGTRPKITKGMLNDMPIYLPKSELYKDAEIRLRDIDKAAIEANKKLKLTKILTKAIQGKVF